MGRENITLDGTILEVDMLENGKKNLIGKKESIKWTNKHRTPHGLGKIVPQASKEVL